MKKETKILKGKALESLLLSIDHFNRQWEVGRTAAVLILLDHSFEMLLKAAILHRGGRIRDQNEQNTIGFDKCVRRGLSSTKTKFLTEEQAFTLQTINGLRDAAQHHFVEISEGHLYVQAQSGLTLFGDILLDVFHENLRDHLPSRALPVTTIAPMDPLALFAEEVEEIRKLLAPKTRRRMEAQARLRGMAIMESALSGGSSQPSNTEIEQLTKKLQDNVSFERLFPGISAIAFSTEGTGFDISLRLTKKEGIPVHTVPDGDNSGAAIAIRRVNELDFYNLGHNQLADKVKISPPKLTAINRFIALHKDPECFREITIGRTTHRRFSQNAIPKVRAALEDPGIDHIWAWYRAAE